jgi:two-component system, cell cycle sensor histidine kinase and response regulator CckA
VRNAAPVVLVVDDEETICEIVTRILRDAGMACITAHTAEAALEWLRTNPWPDLFIVDVRLPNMSRPELVLETMRIRQGTPVLYISGYPRTTVMDDHSLDETVSFLPKPFGYEELTAAVRRLLGSAAASS